MAFKYFLKFYEFAKKPTPHITITNMRKIGYNLQLSPHHTNNFMALEF